MPLVKSGSKKAIGENVKREMNAGKPRRQAIAIAMDVMRRNKMKKMAQGGLVDDTSEPMSEETHSRLFGEPHEIAQAMVHKDPEPADDKMKSAQDSMRKAFHYAEGGSVDPMQSAQDSMRKAFHYADGGEVAESLADDHINSGFMEDDFLSQDSAPMPEDLSRASNMIQADDPDDQKKRRISSIMAELHARHYGKK